MELTAIKKRLFLRMFLSLLFVIAITGCPRYAYVEAYNNTSVTLSIESAGLVQDVAPDTSTKIRFTGSSLQIRSSLGVWKYNRNIPHSGNNGPYFDGTLKVQINSNGVVYALRVSEAAPLSDFVEQPQGYPLHAK